MLYYSFEQKQKLGKKETNLSKHKSIFKAQLASTSNPYIDLGKQRTYPTGPFTALEYQKPSR